ncbi:MAG: Mut7-C RNAse domain-containing protein [Acidobacteriota bacterium]
MKFLADSMLGRLARWLRFAGIDCAYQPNRRDEPFLSRARAEGRFILTLDRDLAAKAGSLGLLLRASNYLEQLREVFKKFHLSACQALTRCANCNAPLARVAREDVFARVPARVYETAPAFYLCTGCSRVYWPGTHAASIEERIRLACQPPRE